MTVFINYRRDDSQAATGRIYDHLCAAFGAPAVFRDLDSIPLGEDFVEHFSARLASCKVVLVIIGTDWLNERLMDPRDFVRIELEMALKRGIPVVPVLVDGAKLPGAAELPEALEPLVRRRGIPIDTGEYFKSQLDTLIDYLSQLGIGERKRLPAATSASSAAPLSDASTPLEMATDGPGSGGWKRRGPIFVFGFCASAIAGGALFFVKSKGSLPMTSAPIEVAKPVHGTSRDAGEYEQRLGERSRYAKPPVDCGYQMQIRGQRCTATRAFNGSVSESLVGSAKGSYESARILYTDGDYQGAASKYWMAYDESSDPRMLWNIAVCEKQHRNYGHVVTLVERYVQEGGALLTKESRLEAEQLLDTLKKLVDLVLVQVTPDRAVVSIDREVFGLSPTGAIPLGLGTHDLRVEKSGFRSHAQRFTVTGGAQLHIAVHLENE